MPKILIVEDDKFLLRVYKVKFNKIGFDSVILESGEETQKVAKEFKPDVVLLDIVMPGKDGFDVLKELKADDQTKNIPAIMLTALSTTDDQEKAKALGADMYLIKTDYTFEEVISIVKKIVAK